jgi:hypothetical protein
VIHGRRTCADNAVRKKERAMKVRGLKVSNPNGVFTYDVSVIFCGSETTVEVAANTMTEAARLVETAGYALVKAPD